MNLYSTIFRLLLSAMSIWGKPTSFIFYYIQITTAILEQLRTNLLYLYSTIFRLLLNYSIGHNLILLYLYSTIFRLLRNIKTICISAKFIYILLYLDYYLISSLTTVPTGFVFIFYYIQITTQQRLQYLRLQVHLYSTIFRLLHLDKSNLTDVRIHLYSTIFRLLLKKIRSI